MSLVCLPKSQNETLTTRRRYPFDVPGTANISYGHKLREDCHAVKYHGPYTIETDEERSTDKKKYDQFLNSLEFERKTNLKIRDVNLRQRIRQDISEYENNLQLRKEKLRDLLLNENVNLMKETVHETQRSADARLEEMRAKTEELKKRQMMEHDAIVSAKRMQQHLASCQDIKLMMSKRGAIDAKQCNIKQMADNEAKILTQKNLDALWHDVMLKDLEVRKCREMEESEKRILARQEMVAILAKQVAHKLVLEEEKKRVKKSEQEYLEQLQKDMRQTELSNLAAEKQKRENLKREFEEQILTAKKYLAERASKEAAIDHTFITLTEEELSKEKVRSKKDSASLHRELLVYLKYLKDLRQQEAKRNLEVEAVVQQSIKDAETKRELAMKKLKEARQHGMQQVLHDREEQLRARQKTNERDRQLQMEERQVVEREIEMNANLTATEQKESRQKALRYRQDLKEQREYLETMKRRELEEERRFHQVTMKEKEEYQRLTNELLNASENIAPHPFKNLFKEENSRHATQQERQCYCPAALNSM